MTPSLAAQARGRWGEELAAARYRRAGFRVVERNWRGEGGEIDLIVTDGTVLVIAEVKARRDERFGGGALAVGRVKQHRLRRLAAQWLAANPWRGPLRFDVVAVTGTRVEVIEAAF